MARFLYFIIIWLPLAGNTQQFYLKGCVKDEAGAPLQNVSLTLKSTGYRYSTGTDGSFGILSRREQDTALLMMDGYHTEQVVLKNAGFQTFQLKKKNVALASANKLTSQVQNLRRETQQSWFAGEETYASLVENSFVPASAYPVTNIAFNVDKASYSNIRRFINSGSRVPPDAVRIEEMLNYFNFNYTSPPPGHDFYLQSTVTAAPWNKNHRLLLLQLHARKLALDRLPPTHLTFLLDVSGSMDMPNRLPLIKAGFRLLTNNLRDEDSISMVIYGGKVALLLESVSGGEKGRILSAIDSIEAGGTTPGESGIKLAYQVAKNHFIEGGNNRVVLATDGDFNVGLRTEEELEKLIVDQKEKGIYLTCLGVGMGNYKDSKIQLLAKKGNGNFAYIDSYQEAEKVLLQEFTQTLFTVADNAYLSLRFDKQEISDYRIIGFDNKYRALLDSLSVMEGSEIGSGYSGMIAIELVPARNFAELTLHTSIHYRAAETGEKKIYTEGAKIKMTPKLEKHQQFACGVLMFGSLLKNSRYLRPTWQMIEETSIPAANPESFSEQEFVKLLGMAKKIYGRKWRR